MATEGDIPPRYEAMEKEKDDSGDREGDTAGSETSLAPLRGSQETISPAKTSTSASIRTSSSEEEEERRVGSLPMVWALAASPRDAKAYEAQLLDRQTANIGNKQLATVFIVVEPPKLKGTFSRYIHRLKSSLFDEIRGSRLSVMILTGDGIVNRYWTTSEKKYLVAARTQVELENFNPTDRDDRPHAFCTALVDRHPKLVVTCVGKTSLSGKDLDLFLTTWNGLRHVRTSERRKKAFVDRFLHYAVTHERVWGSKARQPPGADQEQHYFLDSSRGFKSPLTWYLWHRRRTAEARHELRRRTAQAEAIVKYTDEEKLIESTGQTNYAAVAKAAPITRSSDTEHESAGEDPNGGNRAAIQLPDLPGDKPVEPSTVQGRDSFDARPESERSSIALTPNGSALPRTSVLIIIVGSRGDVQPFLAVGMELKKLGFRVRLATHECFRKFVIEEGGLEFYPLGGDPAELMAYMVKNPGLIPTRESIIAGDIQKKRDIIYEILHSAHRACHDADPGPPGTSSAPSPSLPPFVPDALISNPPTFAHIHLAEYVAIPLHIMFTMPWSPTRAFPHPLLNIEALMKKTNKEGNALNLYSYTVCELLTWQGLGDVINRWRHTDLRLPGIPLGQGANIIPSLKVPHTYAWSPNLISKPTDWGAHLEVTGFCFLPTLSEGYVPDERLRTFLDTGPKPVYIGFGSIVVDDPMRLTSIIFEALRITGLRAIISKGWGGFGGREEDCPKTVLLIGNCPHDWLFQQVSAVCHHGGAGTTAAGLAAGRPTIVVPFFGDQPFWGKMIHQAGAGPAPLPHKKITTTNFVQALLIATSDGALLAASTLGSKMRRENGARSAALSFTRHLPLHAMRCDVDPTRPAMYYGVEGDVKLSSAAAEVLISERRVRRGKVFRYVTKRWILERAYSNPITAVIGGVRSVIVNVAKGVAGFFVQNVQGVMRTRGRGFLDGVKEVLKGFGKGIGAILYYPFKGLGTFFGHIIDGCENINVVLDESELPRESPLVYGAIDGFVKGVVSCAKHVLIAFWDLISKPCKGAHRDGFSGLMIGCGLGLLAFVTKIVAGGLELLYLPVRGLVITVHRCVNEDAGVRRVSPSVSALPPPISPEERSKILRSYDSVLKFHVGGGQ